MPKLLVEGRLHCHYVCNNMVWWMLILQVNAGWFLYVAAGFCRVWMRLDAFVACVSLAWMISAAVFGLSQLLALSQITLFLHLSHWIGRISLVHVMYLDMNGFWECINGKLLDYVKWI